MSKKFIKRNKNIITQLEYLPMSAYKALRTLAKDHNAEIVEDEDGYLTLTFDEVKTAENVANRFRTDYAEAHKAYTPKQKDPKTTKKTTKPSSTKKGNVKKMTLDDFIINNPSCTREEAKAYGFKGTRADLRARKVELGVR